jgi:hypothetical protein
MIYSTIETETNTLTDRQIQLIKQGIAIEDSRLVIDITDQEVWDRVEDKMYAENAQGKTINFQTAANMCMDDYDVAIHLGYC